MRGNSFRLRWRGSGKTTAIILFVSGLESSFNYPLTYSLESLVARPGGEIRQFDLTLEKNRWIIVTQCAWYLACQSQIWHGKKDTARIRPKAHGDHWSLFGFEFVYQGKARVVDTKVLDQLASLGRYADNKPDATLFRMFLLN